jgi:hypothetical protein
MEKIEVFGSAILKVVDARETNGGDGMATLLAKDYDTEERHYLDQMALRNHVVLNWI